MNILTRLTCEHLKSNKTHGGDHRRRGAIHGADLCVDDALWQFSGVYGESTPSTTTATSRGHRRRFAHTGTDAHRTRGVESAFWTAQLGTAVLEGSQNPDKPYLSVQGFDAAAMERAARST